ncbi:hypothetical protein [Psychrobacter glacincola]|uniref:hypothetical protein n=1 Tax=Psychrobacter glacincola TaxID=56810 RepID=UPI0039B0BBE2
MKNLNVLLPNIKTIKHRGSVSSKSILTVSALLASTLLISACQSTGVIQANHVSANTTPTAAKTALATALQQQRRQSFAYHSNIEIVNEQQFADIDSTQLLASGDLDSYCKDTHDNGYAELLLEAGAQNQDILATDYDAQRNTLKQAYLVCSDAYQTWRDSHYDSEAYSVEMAAEEVVGATATDTTEEAASVTTMQYATMPAFDMDSASEVNTKAISPYYEKIFDEYDNRKTKLDVKKAQLLDAYLLKPLSINAQGVYQPLAGKFTMLGSVQYSARNHHSSINQPIYVDFKTGSMYLWADNFALLTSKFADDKLGTKWQNKWLKIALDDGTLPKGFGRAAIKSHIEAENRVYAKAAIEQFDVIAPNILTTLSPKLPEKQLAAMLNTPKIIRRARNSAEYKQDYQDYMGVFYQLITKQYPELILENDSDTQADADTDSNYEDRKMTSKWLVQQTLDKMKDFADDKVLKTQETTLPVSSSILPVQELYGFNKQGQLQWQHSRHYLPSKSGADASVETSNIMDVLNQYMPLRGQDKAFPNLASDSQVPNASNSIDLKEYSAELAEYYKQGNGTAMGQMLFNMLPMYKQRLGAMD